MPAKKKRERCVVCEKFTTDWVIGWGTYAARGPMHEKCKNGWDYHEGPRGCAFMSDEQRIALDAKYEERLLELFAKLQTT